MTFKFTQVYHGSEGLEQFFRTLTNGTLAIPLMFAMILFWLNGDALWPGYFETSTAMAYIIMFTFVIAISSRRSQMMLTRLRTREGIQNFTLGFLLMFAGMIGLNYAFGGGISSASISKVAVWPAVVITAFYVAPVEESIFRGLLKEYFSGWRLYTVPLGIFVTSALFAVTHYAVYGGAVQSMWWAFLMGCVFYMMATWKGVPSSTGAHTAYNLFVLGILSGGIV